MEDQSSKSPLTFSENIIKSFSLTEKVIFYLSALIISLSVFVLIWQINENFLVSVPARGGTLVEGIVGYPRFINPILSYTDAGDDLSALIYSGLLKATPKGLLINDLAKEYTVSDDHLTYTFTLKDDLRFHDGKPVTTSDIEFTVKKAIDPALKSPLRVKWEGVSVEKVDDKTIKFILKNPYAPFLENMTLGILPEHIWKNDDSEEFSFSKFNTEPIGSGPYKIAGIKRNVEGIPLYYKLESFDKYALGEPLLKNIVIKFYTTETALLSAYNNGEVESINAISGKDASSIIQKNGDINKTPLPRVFGIFFNQNQSTILADKQIRKALDLGLDRKEIIEKVLYGFGTEIRGPIPSGFTETTEKNSTKDESAEANIESAKQILKQYGWTLGENGFLEKKTKNETTPLQFSISTSNTPELIETANLIKEQWAKIGIDVTVKVFEQGDFNQTILRPRKYDALLFGEIIGRDLDLYSFWHSSERNDPGLNIALYANSKVDKSLSLLRSIFDEEEKKLQLNIVEEEISNDIPALFIYSPDYIYILPKKIKDFKIGKIVRSEERFANVYEWYVDQDKVWKIFAK